MEESRRLETVATLVACYISEQSWLKIRHKRLLFERAGSNPADVVFLYFWCAFFFAKKVSVVLNAPFFYNDLDNSVDNVFRFQAKTEEIDLNLSQDIMKNDYSVSIAIQNNFLFIELQYQ